MTLIPKERTQNEWYIKFRDEIHRLEAENERLREMLRLSGWVEGDIDERLDALKEGE